MSVMICSECENYIDTDFDDFDFETGKCMECLNDKCETCPFVGSERCECGCPFMERIEE